MTACLIGLDRFRTLAGSGTCSSPPSGATSYAYDGTGLLQSETTGSATTDLTWDILGSVPTLLSDGTGDYLYGPSATPVEQVSLSSGTPSYLLADHLGSVRAITSPTGAVTAGFTYDAWGNASGTSGTATTPFRYAGGYLDSASRLYCFRARWYDPGTGQFMSLGPLVAQTLQPYSYVGNDPLNGTDPTGQYMVCGGRSCASIIAQQRAAARRRAAQAASARAAEAAAARAAAQDSDNAAAAEAAAEADAAQVESARVVYEACWKQNPNAPVGAATAAVEASGASASWYGAPVTWLKYYV